jgi:hypothetical protein
MADAQHAAVVQAASAIALSKLKAIADRLHAKGKEPTTDEARFAATFTESVRIDTLIRWLEQLQASMECQADAAKIGQFIVNLKE